MDESKADFFETEFGKRVKEIEIKMLKETVRICKKNGIRYFADSGTLLGAVRHKGFIPWDDDIDLVMLRPDYDKFLHTASEFNSPYFLQCAYTDIKYPRGHAQIRYDGTTMMLPTEAENVPFHQGIFIDIFPLDVMPERRKQNFLNRIYFHQRINFTLASNTKRLKENHHFIKKIVRIFVPFTPHYRLFERLCSKYWGKNGYIDKISWRGRGAKYLNMAQSWYGKTVELPFEDMTISCPAEYDKVLKEMYGQDYMTPIKGISSHGEVIISVDRSYREIILEKANEKEI